MTHVYAKHENRTWDGTVDDPWQVQAHGLGPLEVVHATLDLTLFDERQHITGGYLPSGVILGSVTDTGNYGPYDPDATDGRNAARGILHSSVLVRWPEDGSLRTTQRGMVITSGAYVRTGPLPFNATHQPSGGYLDDDAVKSLTEAGFAFKHTPRYDDGTVRPATPQPAVDDHTPHPTFVGGWNASKRVGMTSN